MANSVGYEKKLEEEMFLHLLTSNFPNLVEKNKHKIYYNFLSRNLWKPKIMNNLPGCFFFCGGVCLTWVDGKVKKWSNEPSLTFQSAFFS